MSLLLLALAAGSIPALLLVVVEIAIVLLVVYVIGKLFFGLLLNTILGLLTLFLVNYFFAISISIHIITLIAIAIFGVPGVLVLLLLKIFGISVPWLI